MSHPAGPNLEALAGHGVLHVLGDVDAEQDLGDIMLLDLDAVDQDHLLFFVQYDTLWKTFSLELGEQVREV